MARNNIKGLTVEIGGDTTKLGKALESVNKKSGDLSAELGEINRQLKFDPKNTELLAQKQKVLAEAVETAGEKLDKLREAEKQVQKQFERGEVSEEQVRALKREIIATESKMEAYKKAAQGAADATEDLGVEADDTSKLMSALSTVGKVIGLSAIANAATSAAEASREYNTEMGKLDTAFVSAGHSSEAATKTYQELQSILGDSGQAVEAANMLAQLANNEQDLAKWTDIATGVFATFGASLPVENIAEAANESAKTGVVVGGLADALNWVKASSDQWNVALGGNKVAMDAFKTATAEGMSAEDAFNAALAACSTEQERQALITSTLTTLYGSASAQYKETNADVIAANEANEKWTASLAEVGASVAPLLTAVKDMGATLLSMIVPVIDAITNNLPIVAVGIIGVTAAMVAFKIAAIAATAATQGMTLAQYAAAAAQGVLNAVMNANPIGLVILAVTALIAIVMALVKNWESVSAFFKNLWEGIKNTFNSAVEGIKKIMGNLVTSAVNKLKELPKKVVSIGGDLISGLWKGVKDKLTWLKNKLSSFATSVLDSIKSFFGVHSPSTETAWIGEMLDEGMAAGVKDNANEPIKAMDQLSSKMLTAASGAGDLTLERKINHTFSSPSVGTADSISNKLDQIYKAILSGQVIMLDSKILVGSTADRYDSELGQRRVLAERGAI